MVNFLNSITNIICILCVIVALIDIFRYIRRIFKSKSCFESFYLFIASFIVLSVIFALPLKLTNEAFPNTKNNSSAITLIWCLMTAVVHMPIFIRNTRRRRRRKAMNIAGIDVMEGHQFEYACADILRANGFKNVRVTRGSGDFGVDIIAYKNGIKYAVQCKRYSNKLSNKPIQEVIGGLAYYGCNKGAVMTNQYFTEPAKKLAEINNVELWDRDVIIRMISKTKKTYDKKDDYNYSETDMNINSVEEHKNYDSKDSTKYAETVSALYDLKEFPEIFRSYLEDLTNEILQMFIMHNYYINFINIQTLYSTNEIIIEFDLCKTMTIAKFKYYVKQIPKSLNIDYAEYIYPTSTPHTVGIKLPLPEYMKKTNKLIAENTENNQQ